MPTTNIHGAKTRLSKLVGQASAGQKIVNARVGTSATRPMPAWKKQTRRSLGALAGRFSVPADLDAPAAGYPRALWAAAESEKIPIPECDHLTSPANDVLFSAASI
jgi:antitoxin (DNA-binding transcriptional repressor) of toxin-antitoxin stability system